jgi:hypothetical protein
VKTVVIPPPFPLFIVALVKVIDEFEREEETSMSHIVEEVALTAFATSCGIQFDINSEIPQEIKRQHIYYDRERAKMAVETDYMG